MKLLRLMLQIYSVDGSAGNRTVAMGGNLADWRVVRKIEPMRILRKSNTAYTLAGGAALGLAIGATAVGALAIGALAIGRIAIRYGHIEKLSVGELTVDKLVVRSNPATES